MLPYTSILVVDDEPDNFDVIETLLYHQGYEFHYAANGQTALEQIDLCQPDVILLDVMMPEIDGIEICRQIKANLKWQSIPIIMVTALTAKEDLARCLSAGADDFISKPVNALELRARLHSMLRIKKQHDDLQALLKLQEDMVNMVVHDLRNPLATILLGTDLLQRFDMPQASQQEKLARIAIAGQQLHTLIDSLLLMAKLNSGNMVLNCTKVSLAEICQSALSGFEIIASQKNIKLISSLTDSDKQAHIDKAIFRRVLDNLLSNAIKFSPKNGQIILEAAHLAKGISVQVADFGTGISEAMKHKIFEKYEIGTLNQEVSQIGLGLAFCKLAVEAHGGQITVTSNQPQGAIFTIFIPQSAP